MEKAEKDAHPGNTDVPAETLSFLFLSTRWQFDTYGLSTVNKCLVNNLRLVDPDENMIKVTCTVLEESGKISDSESKDAEKYKVKLGGARQPRGKKGKPDMAWLEQQSVTYYRHLVMENKFDFLVGHIPYLVDGCLNLRDLSRDFHQGHSPKVILFAHALPLRDDGDVDEEMLTEWLQEADLIFSVGDGIFTLIDCHIESNDLDIEHRLYLPGFPLDFFEIERNPRKCTLTGEQSILVMTSDLNPNVSGVDMELAVVATSQSSDNIMYSEGSDLSRQLSFSFKLITSTDEEKSQWDRMFLDIKEKYKIEARAPEFKFCAPQEIKKLFPHLKRGTLLVLPLKSESSLYGVEALVAMASGIPVLVSRNSGMASFLQRLGEEEPIVCDNEGLQKNIIVWKERMIHKITNPDQAQRSATELRRKLVLDTRIAETHLEFLGTVAGKIFKLNVNFRRL